MIQSHRIPASSQGFTLLEILLTMTLFAFIMSMLLSSYFQIKKAQQSLDTQIVYSQDIQVVKHIIQNDLYHITCVPQWNAVKKEGSTEVGNLGNLRLFTISGNQAQPHMVLSFFSRSPSLAFRASDITPNIAQITYSIENDQLVRRESFYLPTQDQNTVEDVLAQQDDSVRINTISKFIVGLNVEIRDPKSTDLDSNGIPLPTSEWGPDKDNLPSFITITLYEKLPKSSTGQTHIVTDSFNITLSEDREEDSKVIKTNNKSCTPL